MDVINNLSSKIKRGMHCLLNLSKKSETKAYICKMRSVLVANACLQLHVSRQFEVFVSCPTAAGSSHFWHELRLRFLDDLHLLQG